MNELTRQELSDLWDAVHAETLRNEQRAIGWCDGNGKLADDLDEALAERIGRFRLLEVRIADALAKAAAAERGEG